LDAGHELPSTVGEAFDLWDVCLPYWQAFLTLHRARGIAIGPTTAIPLPLQYTEMAAYARDHGLADTREELDETVTLLIELDQLYLAHVASRQGK
jgi:hypothetical protein